VEVYQAGCMEFVIISSYPLFFLELLAVHRPNKSYAMLQQLLLADPAIFCLLELYWRVTVCISNKRACFTQS